ncbi:MAG: YHYH protein [Chloroflexi bacterium]|nr:MAG: YHYH protein [Chloroflexota bacterium]
MMLRPPLLWLVAAILGAALLAACSARRAVESPPATPSDAPRAATPRSEPTRLPTRSGEAVTPPVGAQPSTTSDTTRAASPRSEPSARIDLTRLPIGDGRVTSSAQIGSVFSCQRQFGGGGAFRDGPWIRSDGTFDLTAKIAVSGTVGLTRQFQLSISGETRAITGNGLPSHPVGTFPVAPSDPTYQYDRNTNTIRAQAISQSIAARPTTAVQPSCLPMGAIGVTLNGVVFFNALDALGRDAVAHEILDGCGGHPERSGQYHYHDQARCIDDTGSGHSPLIGYALDGFGLFGHRGENGNAVVNADLDACHGHTHAIDWDGVTTVLYHYHATYEYPYTLGCYRGTPARRGP